MKERVRNIINMFFFKMGFFPPERVLSGAQIKEDYKNASQDIREFIIRKYFNYFALNNDHKGYEKFLFDYGIEINFSTENKSFLNSKGNGAGSLNTFRKVKKNNDILFEKIYFSYHKDLKHTLFFYDKIYPILKQYINIPNLNTKIYGDEISAIYFTFLNLKRHSSENVLEEKLITISKTLINLKIEESFKPPFYIYNFIEHSEYRLYREIAKNNLRKFNIDLTELEDILIKSKTVISHGDLNISNVYEDNIIIDWDSFGIYPIGFDIAYLYQRLLWKGIVDENYNEWVYSNYLDFFTEKDEMDIFKMNFLIFLYVFSFRLKKASYFKELENQLRKEITKIIK